VVGTPTAPGHGQQQLSVARRADDALEEHHLSTKHTRAGADLRTCKNAPSRYYETTRP
jgi:hypothetical protein